jgi:acyl-coenzyme A synthetase/AMP-(fatty) acid ligase
MPALISHTDPRAILACDQGRLIKAHEYLADVRNTAARLPQQGFVLNLCTNRYHFAVVMGAALLRQQPMLLPSTRTPEMLLQLDRQYPGLYAVVDQPEPALQMPQFQYLADATPHPSAEASFEVPRIDAEQIAAYVFTSGSTGQPVPHTKRWGMMVHNSKAEGERVRQNLEQHNALSPSFSVTATVPAQHMYGFESSVLLPLHNQAVLDASHPFYPADIAQALHRVPAPRVLVTTPFHLRALLESQVKVPALDLLLSATAPLPPQLANQAEQALGAPLLEIYGCTECGQMATRRTTATLIWETYKDLEIRQQAAPDNEPVFLAQGAHIEGSVPLNDVLELHSSTRFTLLGRHADMVNIAGKRTSLAYLNHQLNSLKGVVDGAFYWPQDDDQNAQTRVRRPIAFVVAPELSEADLRRALHERIDPVFMPRPIYFVSQLPRNSTGKLPQQALAELAQALKDGARG